MNNREDPRFEQLNYLDRYRKARLAVKNHPILTRDGDYKPLNSNQLPNDAHEYLGARLPNEVYYYLSHGLINARILQWRTTCEIYEVPPMDGGESPEYRKLVSSTISPLRTTAINLLSSALHNWYRHKDLTLRCWFSDSTGKPQSSVISMKGLPETSTIVDTWNVKETTFKPVVEQHKVSRTAEHANNSRSTNGIQGMWTSRRRHSRLTGCRLCPKDGQQEEHQERKHHVQFNRMQNVTFPQPLSTLDEIVYNSIWRFLAARDYVDANHNLTLWGKVLATVIASLKGKAELEDGAVLAVEMMRLGLLNGDINMFPEYNGAPIRGSRESPCKRNILALTNML